jgi:hypothetical protein
MEQTDDGLKTGSFTTLMMASEASLTYKSDRGSRRTDLSSIGEGESHTQNFVTELRLAMKTTNQLLFFCSLIEPGTREIPLLSLWLGAI